MSKETLSCVDCMVRNCEFRNSMYPDFCLTTDLTEDQVAEVLELYGEEEQELINGDQIRFADLIYQVKI